MKAMSTTLTLVVVAIVILITAVIVLTIFWQGVTPAVGLTEAKSICQTQATVSCATFNKMPPTWNVENMKVTVDGKTSTMSCSKVPGITGNDCAAYGSAGTGTSGDAENFIPSDDF